MAAVRGHRIALVAPAGQHHRRPEAAEAVEMLVPILHRGVEKRTNPVVLADACIEGVNHLRQLVVVEIGRGFHRRLRIMYRKYIIAALIDVNRSEEHTSELQSIMSISY